MEEIGVIARLLEHAAPGEDKIAALDRIARGIAPAGGGADVKSPDGLVETHIDAVGPAPGCGAEGLRIEGIQAFPQGVADGAILEPGHIRLGSRVLISSRLMKANARGDGVYLGTRGSPLTAAAKFCAKAMTSRRHMSISAEC